MLQKDYVQCFSMATCIYLQRQERSKYHRSTSKCNRKPSINITRHTDHGPHPYSLCSFHSRFVDHSGPALAAGKGQGGVSLLTHPSSGPSSGQVPYLPGQKEGRGTHPFPPTPRWAESHTRVKTLSSLVLRTWLVINHKISVVRMSHLLRTRKRNRSPSMM